MINLVNICQTYQAADIQTAALDSVSLKIEPSDFVAVMGPSGCGKSTLLNLLGLLDIPKRGEYYFDGNDIARYSETQMAKLRKQNIGFIFQSFNLIDELTVAENVAMPLLYHKITRSERRARVEDALHRMNIAHRAKHRPQQLSGGQQQRVAIARAVVTQPRLILADEPTGNLDSKHGEEVMDLLTELNMSGTAIFMVTHSMQHAEYAHRLVRLLDGRLVSEEALR